MQVEIKKAISKAMAKLVGFSLNEKAMKGHYIEVAIHGRFRSDIWVYLDEENKFKSAIINAPSSIDDINRFESEVEKLMADIKVIYRFHAVAGIMATLNTEVNE